MIIRDPNQAVSEMIQKVGPKIVLATNLGVGKPVQLLNALYERVRKDSSLHLTILTALSLCKPKLKGNLVKRLAQPYLDRVFGDYQDLLYELDRRAQVLPSNVRIIEFFLTAGAYLNNPLTQQNVIYSNYTHVVRDLGQYGVNVLAINVAEDEKNPARFSLSCNADLTMDMLREYRNILLAGEINTNLPYMYGDQAEIEAERFHFVLKNDESRRKLFSIPQQALTTQEYLIGLYTSSLIADDGCLQIGIGNLSDAVVYSLILRHTKNELYREVLKELFIEEAHSDPFAKGLFALTEMLVDGYISLYQKGILKKELSDSKGSYIAYAGFFVGSNTFYDHLRALSPEERRRFSMRSIQETNQLYGDEARRRKERTNCRFVNTCLKVTLFGDNISDTLSNGLTLSGVGGQYNFVAMAHELPNARSIMICRSVRELGAKTESNIVFSTPFATIPRHLRDVVVTEYGIAHLRGKTDEEVVKAMLNVADSRFQNDLLQKAKAAKKIPDTYQIPPQFRNNLPNACAEKLHQKRFQGLFEPFPFGTEWTDEEIALTELLKHIHKASTLSKMKMVIEGLFSSPKPFEANLLGRMNLERSRSLKECLMKALLLGGLKTQAK